MVMTAEEAKQLIPQEDTDRMAGWVLGGASDYFLYEPEKKRVHSKRSRASLIHDHVIDRILKGFEEMQGAQLFRRQGRYLLSVNDSYLASIKKLDKSMRARGIRTGQAVAFIGQLPLFDMPPGVTHLILGYRLNDLQTGIEGVYIMCPDGDAVSWHLRIGGPEMLQLPMEVAPSTPKMPGMPQRAKLKEDIAADEKEENASDS